MLLALTVPLSPQLFAQTTFPEGAGKDLVLDKCAGCHGLDQVQLHRDNAEGWEGVVNYMVSRGMAVSEEETKTVIAYLAKSFPKDDPKQGKPDSAKGKGKAK